MLVVGVVQAQSSRLADGWSTTPPLVEKIGMRSLKAFAAFKTREHDIRSPALAAWLPFPGFQGSEASS